MKAKDAMILWDDVDSGRATAGQCRVVHHNQEDDKRFLYSGGVAWLYRKELKGDAQLVKILLDFIALVVGYGLDPVVVIKEFRKIDEFSEHFAEDLTFFALRRDYNKFKHKKELADVGYDPSNFDPGVTLADTEGFLKRYRAANKGRGIS